MPIQISLWLKVLRFENSILLVHLNSFGKIHLEKLTVIGKIK